MEAAPSKQLHAHILIKSMRRQWQRTFLGIWLAVTIVLCAPITYGQAAQPHGQLDSTLLRQIDTIATLPDSIAYDHIMSALEQSATLAPKTMVHFTRSTLTKRPANMQEEIYTHLIDLCETRRTEDSLSYIYALNLKGELLARNQKRQEAVKLFLKVLEFYPKKSMEIELGYTNNNIGNILEKENDPVAALPFLQRASDIFTHHYGKDDLSLTVINSNLAVTYGLLGQKEKEVDILTECYRVRKKKLPFDHKLMQDVRINLCIALRALDRFDASEHYIREAQLLEEKSQQFNIKRWLSISVELLATTYSHSKKYDKDDVDRLYNRILNQALKHVDPYNKSMRSIYNNYGVFLHNNKRHEASLQYFKNAVKCHYPSMQKDETLVVPSSESLHKDLSEELGVFMSYATALYLVGTNEDDESILLKSGQVFTFCDTIADKIRHIPIHSRSRIKVKKDIRRMYVLAARTWLDLYDRTHDPKYVSKLFDGSEKNKSWELFERFSMQSQQSDFLNIEAHIAEQKIDVDQAQKIAAATIQKQESTATYPITTLEKLQGHCRATNERWITYGLASGGQLYALYIDQDTIALSTMLAPSDSIHALSNACVTQIQAKSWQFTTNAHKLYQILLAPFSQLIQPGRLTICPEQNVSNIPFSVLLHEHIDSTDSYSGELPYVLNSFEINYMQSASLGTLLHDDFTVTTSSSFAPHYVSDQLRLSFNLDEAKSMEKHLGANVYTENTTTESEFIHALKTNDIVHYAGHVISGNSTDSIYLLLKEGSDTLFIDEIMGVSNSAKLMVLSACQSAQGPRLSPEAMIGPAYAFTFAGTPNTISTRWNVDDEKSVAIFSNFYNQLAAQVPSITALTNAKRQFIKNQPKPSRHPYYWASTQYIGTDVTYCPKSKIPWTYIILGCGFLGLIITFRSIRK